MSKLELSPDNPYNGMEREDFIKLLEDMGFTVTDGTGKITYEEEEDIIGDKKCPKCGGNLYLFHESKDVVRCEDCCNLFNINDL